jgi:hypothetical protein
MQRYAELLASGALLGMGLAGIVAEDPAHHHGGESVKVRPVGEVDPALPDQPEVQFIDQRGGLQSMVATFAAKKAGSDHPEVVVRQGRQARQRSSVTFAPPD